LITVLLLIQRTICIFVPCSNAGHTAQLLTKPCFQRGWIGNWNDKQINKRER